MAKRKAKAKPRAKAKKKKYALHTVRKWKTGYHKKTNKGWKPCNSKGVLKSKAKKRKK